MSVSTTQNGLSPEPIVRDEVERADRGPGCVHRRFEEQAARLPGALALTTAAENITLGELDSRANRMSTLLSARGIGPGSKVAIMVPRSVDAVICVLACLKSGAAYVPIGVNYPKRLISGILGDSDVDLVLGHRALEIPCRAPVARVHDLDEGGAGQGGPSPDWPGDALACVLYTSGSSGRPKGVRITQRGMMQRCSALWTLHAFADGERAVQNTSLTVVDSFWELWGPLCQGIPVLLLDDDASQDLPRFIAALAEHQVTRICLVPSLLRQLLATEGDLSRRLPQLRQWVASGEPMTRELVSQFYKHLPNAILFNQYGLTETTADITSCDTRALSALGMRPGPVPIGVPFPGVTLSILDEQLEPVADGEEGELYVGGDCVADGYLRMPDLTAERLLPAPFSSDGGRMLRTGDRARRLATGEFLVTGRADRQVKVRGYRVELDGLEALISGHSAVDCVAVMCRLNGAGHTQLIAYCSSGTEGAALAPLLREYCAAQAPAYMMPHRFVFVREMPRTPSGKIDRTALPSSATEQTTLVERPELPYVQDQVRRIWCRLLGAPDVGGKEEFFGAGGDSLLMMKMLGEIRHRFGCDVSVRQFVSQPSLQALCELILAGKGAAVFSEPPEVGKTAEELLRQSSGGAPGRRFRASLSQTAIWMHEQLAQAGNPYGITVSATLSGVLDASLLKSACQSVVHAEPAVRTRFATSAEGLEQEVVSGEHLAFEVLEGRNIPREQRNAFVDNHIRRVASRRLDVSREAPMLVRVVALADGESILIVQVHHMVCDGQSVKILLKKIAGVYNASVQGQPLKASAPDYRSVAVGEWEHRAFEDVPEKSVDLPHDEVPAHSRRLARAMAYWEGAVSELEGAQALPSDYPSGGDPSFDGREIIVEVERHRVERYLGQMHQRGVTPFHLFSASYSMALFRTFKVERQMIGFTNSTRPAELDDALGCYITTLPCLARVSESTTYPELLERVGDSLWNAIDNGEIPFEVVLSRLRAKRRATGFRGFQTVVSYDQWAIEHLQLDGLTVQPRRVHNRWSKFPVSLNIEVAQSTFVFLFEYRTKLYAEATIGSLATAFVDELERFAAQC